jgi:hypothetical protein
VKDESDINEKKKSSKPSLPISSLDQKSLLAFYQHANLEVARLCNHQKSVPKSSGTNVWKLEVFYLYILFYCFNYFIFF